MHGRVTVEHTASTVGGYRGGRKSEIDGGRVGQLACCPMKRWSVAAVVAVVLAMPSPAPAGWRADCRATARACRKSRGASLVTTTTIPSIACPSQNCGGGHCIMFNGQPYVLMWDALDGACSLPMGPDCSLCSEYCSSATTSTTAP
jgi:hypothetical protein